VIFLDLALKVEGISFIQLLLGQYQRTMDEQEFQEHRLMFPIFLHVFYLKVFQQYQQIHQNSLGHTSICLGI